MIPFYNFLFLSWKEVLTMDTMGNLKKLRYLPVHIRGYIPGAVLCFLSPRLHSGAVASVLSSFLPSTSIQETSRRAASFAPRAEASSEWTKYS